MRLIRISVRRTMSSSTSSRRSCLRKGFSPPRISARALSQGLDFSMLREMDEDLDLVGGVVVHVLDLDLALGVGSEDGLDEGLGGDAIGQLGDGEEIF